MSHRPSASIQKPSKLFRTFPPAVIFYCYPIIEIRPKTAIPPISRIDGATFYITTLPQVFPSITVLAHRGAVSEPARRRIRCHRGDETEATLGRNLGSPSA